MEIKGLGGLKRLTLAAVIAAAVFPVSAFAQSVEQFYSGKTINLIVPYATGGYYDTGARLVARHFGPQDVQIVPPPGVGHHVTARQAAGHLRAHVPPGWCVGHHRVRDAVHRRHL